MWDKTLPQQQITFLRLLKPPQKARLFDVRLFEPNFHSRAGTVAPGASSNMTIYIRNLGNAAVVLNTTVTSWSPIEASSCLTCTWNREGFTLKPKSKVQAVLVLSVLDGTVDVNDLSFVTIISGAEA